MTVMTSPARPLSVTLLAIGVLTLVVAGWVRLDQAIALSDFLITLSVSPIYLGITGLMIGITGLPSVWGLWRGLRWAPRYSITYLIAVIVFFWIDRQFLAKSAIVTVNTPFALLMTGIIM
ncbi:MAG: hypothetical protein HC806_10800, partial [Anaerolineae bacterium]|nr:hypothetical protein [Anaerolineae bacterium]